MNKFCGDSSINFEGSSQSISLPRVGESYGRESLLCQYVFKNSHPKNTIYATVDITPKYISNAKFVIGATFEDGTSTKRELVLTQNLVRIGNANEITIYYIQSKLFRSSLCNDAYIGKVKNKYHTINNNSSSCFPYCYLCSQCLSF